MILVWVVLELTKSCTCYHDRAWEDSSISTWLSYSDLVVLLLLGFKVKF